MNAVILQRADHLQSRAITHMREAWVPVAAKISLQDAPILRPVENRAPGFQFTNAIGRLPGVQFRHPPLIYILAATHRVGEMNFPIVALIDIRERGSYAP